MIILIDIDGTLRNTWKSYCELAHYVGVDLPKEGPETYFFLDEYKEHPKYGQLNNLWLKQGLFMNASPYPGAVEAVKYLDARPEFDVFLVTQPMLGSETAHSENVAWVRWALGPGMEKRLIQTFDRTLIQADILIDDKPEITGCCLPTWTHTLFDQPYNQHIKDQGRIMDWSRFYGN